MKTLAIIELSGILLASVGVGWYIHPGAGVATAGLLLLAETLFGGTPNGSH